MSNNLVIDIEGIDLNTYEGQKELTVRLQKIIAAGNLAPFDLKRIDALKDLVKLSKDLDTLRMYVELKNDMEKLKDRFAKQM